MNSFDDLETYNGNTELICGWTSIITRTPVLLMFSINPIWTTLLITLTT